MKNIIVKEIESINSFKSNINNAVGIFGSARVNENENYYILAKESSQLLAEHGYQIISGGGPGLMKAAIEGACAAGVKSVALNISLPFEDNVLPHDKISLNFDYFMTRKLAFSVYCNAFIAMPGGFGTLDEVFEMLTLMQTRKMRMKPIFLFGTSFWLGAWNWLQDLHKAGFISTADLDNIFITDSVVDVLKILEGSKNG